MDYKVIKSFVDPLTGALQQQGAVFSCSDKEHAKYLLNHELIEVTEDKRPDTAQTSTRKRQRGEANATD
ncbi:hypothetical protein GCM10010451_68380 [Streptomyces virens]|uniref:Uncharacterized protein n=2 Tax=Actinomycetes TaxID=1760 RepID=A0ABP6HGX7_9ACTN